MENVQERKWNRTEIDWDLVISKLNTGFTMVMISGLLDIPYQTLRNRMVEEGIKVRDHKYTDTSDQQLDEMIYHMLKTTPTIGFTILLGKLKSNRIRVTKKRAFESYKRVLVCVANPFRKKIQRRIYSVRAPLSLWHLDANLKLKVWRFYIHGIIDGYSRVVGFLTIAANNLASTVFEGFMGAVEKFGLPSRVRGDFGGENILVAKYMIQRRGEGRGSFIPGPSVHNVRIERFWKDVFQSASGPFYHTFTEMEENKILDSNNELDLFCLHFVSMNLLERHMAEIQNTWNCHSLRTERNMTPEMLFEAGLILLKKQQNKGNVEDEEFTELVQNFDGIEDWPRDAVVVDSPAEDDLPGGDIEEIRKRLKKLVDVPRVIIPLSDIQMQVFKRFPQLLAKDVPLKPNPNMRRVIFVSLSGFQEFQGYLGKNIPFTPWFNFILNSHLKVWWKQIDNL
uniref:Integrase catalytic domain-containing protein n=1 Tax=Daphnia galeata TaxID=27404 RepID=A0A8J2RJS5_9CRUS|nr:unnamed protein product [Daphnia galeata]